MKHILVAESDHLLEISPASPSFMDANLEKVNGWDFVGEMTKAVRMCFLDNRYKMDYGIQTGKEGAVKEKQISG